MQQKVDRQKLYTQIQQKRLKEAKDSISNVHPADIAYLINDSQAEFQLSIFLLLSNHQASDVLPELYPDVIEQIIDNIAKTRLLNIIDEMSSDEAVDLISEMDDDKKSEILDSILDEEDKKSITELLTYDEDSAGGLMESEVIAVHKDFTISQVIDFISDNFQEVENLHYIFIVDDANILLGQVSLTRLIVSQKNTLVGKIMQKDIFYATVDMDQEKVAHIFRKYDIYSLPVVDNLGALKGRITVDDIIDVIDDEASEDAYKMVGLESEDKVFSTPISSVKKRLPWLSLNLLTAFLVSSVVGIFEPTIAKLSFLAVLMPIVAGLGGNSGTQTLTVIVRGIALGELTIHNTYRAIVKELTVGIINGVVIGSFASIIAFFFKGDFMLGVVLGVAMICNMFIASIVGSLIPVVMKKLKFDPALASGILITMLTDIGGFASFLGLATIFLM